jgi:8-oxo-dGTP diphosphatase
MRHAVAVRAFRLLALVPSGLRQRMVRTLKPSYTVGATCLFHRDNKVLLVKQSYRSRWGLPGGLLDRSEIPFDAVVREVFEEIGIRLTPVDEPFVAIDEDDQTIGFIYIEPLPAELKMEEVVALSAEIERVEWFDVNALPPLHDELAAGIERLVKRLDG